MLCSIRGGLKLRKFSRRKCAVIVCVVVLFSVIVGRIFWGTRDSLNPYSKVSGLLQQEEWLSTDGPVKREDKEKDTKLVFSNQIHSEESLSGNEKVEGQVMKEIMRARHDHLQKVCSTMNLTGLMYKPSGTRYLRQLVVDDRKRLIYCFIPKIACTNFKRVFLYLAGVVNRTHVRTLPGYDVHFTFFNRLKTLKQYPEEDRKFRLKHYKKIIAVRDPFERLVSGYRNKFFHPNPKEVNVFMRPYKHYYSVEAPKKKVKNIEHVPSLSEFLQYIIDLASDGKTLNEHWAPYWELCHPCQIVYDYIIKYEHLTYEANSVFSEENIDVQFPSRADTYSSVLTKEVMGSFSKMVPDGIVQQLWNLLKYDAFLFNYSKPGFM